MHKYQFHIAFNDKANTAASKAVQDCKSILSEMGYRDFSIEDVTLNDSFYILKLLVRLIRFFLKIERGALIAIQYPLLSGNAKFKYFIKAARLKNVKFFCVVHDLDDLRYEEEASIQGKDIEALNYYDYVIVHNSVMKEWLQNNGLIPPAIILHAFDYLSVVGRDIIPSLMPEDKKAIVFAGNLSKSQFVYMLDIINKRRFNLYGPNYLPEKASAVKNICWYGSLSPDEILTNMQGAFGLVWDGEYIDRLDTAYGNYLKYNYPHKLSLYLAAGLPVIAPRQSAISSFIEEHSVGVLIDNLLQLQELAISEPDYIQMKNNARRLSSDLKVGKFFFTAVAEVETEIFTNEQRIQINPII
jgi:glycosyltransferase involved in cell wall biosynthesis